ncbi:MAG: 2-hydroxyacid dehydrogenase [Candidatus Wenzhouxiangella sp. M2_3B_020]
MALLVATPGRDGHALAERLREHLPDADIRVWPVIGELGAITFVLAWKPPEGLLSQLPNLRAVSSLGAGADHLLSAEIPDGVELGRLAGSRLAADMAAYLVGVTAGHWKRLDRMLVAQQERTWPSPSPGSIPTVGLLGTGSMGTATARAFRALEVPVHGWRRSGRPAEDLTVHAGRKGLHRIAGLSDVLINLLPLTDETRDILGAELFAAMRPGSMLINVGRGEHLVESELLEALDAGRPGCAVLDVFREEPLPEAHPFWTHPRILVTPHCAAVTRPDEAAELAAESYRRVMAGKPPIGRVDRRRGY